jgi:hypothetical protein
VAYGGWRDSEVYARAALVLLAPSVSFGAAGQRQFSAMQACAPIVESGSGLR